MTMKTGTLERSGKWGSIQFSREMRRVGVSGEGGVGLRSKSLAKALRKMGGEASQGLEGVVKAQLSLEAAKFWRC